MGTARPWAWLRKVAQTARRKGAAMVDIICTVTDAWGVFIEAYVVEQCASMELAVAARDRLEITWARARRDNVLLPKHEYTLV